MWTSSFNKIKSILISNVILSICLIPFVDFTIIALLSLLVVHFCMNGLGANINCHRYLSHRSFEYRYSWMKYLFSMFGILSATGSAIGWVGVHRMHHKESDRSLDPHNPKKTGYWGMLFVDYDIKSKDILRHSLDIARDKFHRITNKYWLLFILAYIAILALFGLNAVYFGFILPAAINMIVQGTTNYINHSIKLGTRHYNIDDNTVDVWWWNILNFGDSLHNSHHANPNRYNNKNEYHKWYEVDPAGWLIENMLMKKENT